MRPMRWITIALALCALSTATWAQDATPRTYRAVLLAYNPILENQGGQRLYQVGGWLDPIWLTDEWVADFAESSHGLVNFRLVQSLNANEYPLHRDGDRYNDTTYMHGISSGNWIDTGTDYKASVRDYDWARKCDAGMLDEVIIYAPPFTGYWETTMCGFGGYWCNSPPQQRIASSRIFIIEGLNYERGVAEGIHSYGHRAESIMSRTYNGWNTNGNRHLWDRFGWNQGQTTISNTFGVGSVHYPPNGMSDYDYGNTSIVPSYAPAWMNDFPNITAQSMLVDHNTWGGPDFHRNFLKWWYAHMPHFDGSNNLDGYDRLNNWWEYLQNLNMHSASGGDHEPGGSPPPASAYAGPLRQYSFDGGDDWMPRVNIHGRMVWFGWDGQDFEIYAQNVDGSNFVQITDNQVNDESPQINDANQIVWQRWDGQDYEICTANADGTNVFQVTGNAVMDWHPDINNAGRIVWDFFDGNDYEIRTANVDGSSPLQLTNNGSVGLRPRDDNWPKINNESPARIVWMGHDGTNWDIFSTTDSTASPIINLSDNTLENEHPVLNDVGRVVWQGWISDSRCAIYSADATGGTVKQITNGLYRDWWPSLNNGNQVVWMSRIGSDWEIVMADAITGSTTSITSNSQHDQYPIITDSNRIVWQGFDGHDWEIYEFDTTPARGGIIRQVTDNDYDDRWPQPGSGDLIVWHAESTDPDTLNDRTTEIWAAGSATLDTTAPEVAEIEVPALDTVRVIFNERVEVSSATDVSNYTLLAGSVIDASLGADGRTATLTVAELTPDVEYTLEINNVTDVAWVPNEITPGTQVTVIYESAQRATDGLLVLYTFDEANGSVVLDEADSGPPLDLTITDPARTTWNAGSLSVDSETAIQSAGPATKIIDACQLSNEITFEAWITPATTIQSLASNILSCSGSLGTRNFTLHHASASGAAEDTFSMRVRSTTTSNNGLPAVGAPDGSATVALTHLLASRDTNGIYKLYLDGLLVAQNDRPGDFTNWDDSFGLILANEVGGFRAWLGTYHLAAVYDRALAADEVWDNFRAGPEATAGPPSGACCDFATYTCTVKPQADCVADGGQYQGDGTTCAADSCLCIGDMDCDSDVDFDDITLFVTAIGDDGTDWEAAYVAIFGTAPPCNFLNGDGDGDGDVDFDDITPFVEAIGDSCLD